MHICVNQCSNFRAAGIYFTNKSDWTWDLPLPEVSSWSICANKPIVHSVDSLRFHHHPKIDTNVPGKCLFPHWIHVDVPQITYVHMLKLQYVLGIQNRLSNGDMFSLDKIHIQPNINDWRVCAVCITVYNCNVYVPGLHLWSTPAPGMPWLTSN